MNKKYLLKSPVRVARLARLLAKGIDLFIILILSYFFYPSGIVISLLYLAAADGMQNGQSVGKRFMGLAVISLEDGKPCTYKQSVIRNLPFIVPLVFSVIPFIGPVFTALIGAPFLVLELYLLFKLDSGHRLGDVMADTSVIANDNDRLSVKKQSSSWFDEDTASI